MMFPFRSHVCSLALPEFHDRGEICVISLRTEILNDVVGNRRMHMHDDDDDEMMNDGTNGTFGWAGGWKSKGKTKRKTKKGTSPRNKEEEK